MKSTWTKILFSALVLILAACSGGGGGGGGGGSVSGDVANDSPTITNPPTAAKGTSEELNTLVAAVGGGNPEAVLTNLFSVLAPQPNKAFANGKGGELEPCMSEEGSNVDGTDGDGFLKYYRFKSTNCQYAGEGPWAGYTETYSDDLIVRDDNDNSAYSNASLTYTASNSWKKDDTKAEVAAGYTAASLSFAGATGLLKMNYKSGGYSNHLAVEPQGYMALWLSIQLSESPLVAIGATVSGYAQFYVQNSGMVTVAVASATNYGLVENTNCLTGGSLKLTFADGSDVLQNPLQQDICMDTFTKY